MTAWIVAGLAIGAVVLVLRAVARRRGTAAAPQVVTAAGAHTGSGEPRWLPGRPALRMPHQLPHPFVELEDGDEWDEGLR